MARSGALGGAAVERSRCSEEPSLLTAEATDAAAGETGGAEGVGAPSPSMRLFYDGGDGSGNAMLFAKVFMEETGRLLKLVVKTQTSP